MAVEQRSRSRNSKFRFWGIPLHVRVLWNTVCPVEKCPNRENDKRQFAINRSLLGYGSTYEAETYRFYSWYHTLSSHHVVWNRSWRLCRASSEPGTFLEITSLKVPRAGHFDPLFSHRNLKEHGRYSGERHFFVTGNHFVVRYGSSKL